MDATELLAEYGPDYFEADLALTLEGDLDVAAQDFASWDWATSLGAALIRRLNTPLGAIASSVWGIEGVIVLNANYGNPAFQYMSEPLNGNTISLLRAGLVACLQQEDRIILINLASRVDLSANLPMLVFDITYSIAGSSPVQVLSIGADQKAGLFIEVVS